MMMTSGLRKFALIVHVMSSIGWFGAVAAFLALAVVGLTSQDVLLVRAAYLAMDVTTWFVIVPLAFASLLTGIVSSLGTRWGLLRHYWVLTKLLVTLFSTIILLVHTQPIRSLAGIAAKTTMSSAHLLRPQIQMVVASGATLVVLTLLTALSVYKPQGMTRYGWRKQHEHYIVSSSGDATT